MTSLFIPSEQRRRRYRRGIQTRVNDLADDYGLRRLVPLQAGDLVVNIGANVGELCLYAVARGARVIALEPDALTLKCLERNTAGRDVTILPVALWVRDERLFIKTDPAEANSGFYAGSDQGEWIEARSLDSLSAQHSFTDIQLLVGDAEGAEPELLQGAAETLRRTRYVSLDCGYERNGQRTLEDCATILRQAGFKILRYQRRKRCNLVAVNSALL